MNTKAVGNKVQDIVSSVTNSKWAKSIVPTIEELNETIAGNSKLSNSIYTKKIQEALGSTLQKAGLPEGEAIHIAKRVNAKNYEEALNNISETISDYVSDKPVDTIIQSAKIKMDRKMAEQIDSSDISTIDKIVKYPGAYFMGENKKVRNTRIATAAAAYAGVAIGGRYLSGGTLTRDNYGRKDIAGVPFV